MGKTEDPAGGLRVRQAEVSLGGRSRDGPPPPWRTETVLVAVRRQYVSLVSTGATNARPCTSAASLD